MLYPSTNDQPVFRNPDKFQVLPFRDWMRKNLPNGRQGMVVEDLDVVLRVYGANYCTDQAGKVMFVELKFGNSQIGPAQDRTFFLIDYIMRAGDPKRERYLGYYVVNYDNEDWDQANFKINGENICKDKFIEFLQLKDIGILGRWDKKGE